MEEVALHTAVSRKNTKKSPKNIRLPLFLGHWHTLRIRYPIANSERVCSFRPSYPTYFARFAPFLMQNCDCEHQSYTKIPRWCSFQTRILHPILHPKGPVNTGGNRHGCRKCRRFLQNFGSASIWVIDMFLHGSSIYLIINTLTSKKVVDVRIFLYLCM